MGTGLPERASRSCKAMKHTIISLQLLTIATCLLPCHPASCSPHLQRTVLPLEQEGFQPVRSAIRPRHQQLTPQVTLTHNTQTVQLALQAAEV